MFHLPKTLHLMRHLVKGMTGSVKLSDAGFRFNYALAIDQVEIEAVLASGRLF